MENISKTRIIDKTKYSIRTYNDELFIKSIHPYDSSEYHWAFSSDNNKWIIRLGSKFVKVIKDKQYDQIPNVLHELDKNIKSRICHY